MESDSSAECLDSPDRLDGLDVHGSGPALAHGASPTYRAVPGGWDTQSCRPTATPAAGNQRGEFQGAAGECLISSEGLVVLL